MASQRPGRDIPRLDYHAINKVPRIDDESLATKPATNLLVEPLIRANSMAVGEASDVIITGSTNLMVTESSTEPLTEPPSLFNDSNIYDDSDDDSPITQTTSILPSESASQLLPRVPRIQATSRIRSPVFKHYITTLLDQYYISKKTKKRTQDRQHKCKQCLYTTLDSKRDGTTNMIKHLEKHTVFLSPSILSSQQPTIDAMFQRPVNTELSTRMMSLEQAILEWIIDTLQPFVVVEHPSFRQMFECIQQLLPLRSRDVVRSCIMS
jgi:hypothetical protein